MSPSEFEPPSHEEDVRRGAGMPQDAGVKITNYTDEEDRAAEKLAAALAAEFSSVFGAQVTADTSSWMLAAHGVLTKLGATVTSGEGGIVIVTLP